MSSIMSLMKYVQNRHDSRTQLFTQIMQNIPPGKEQIRLGFKRVIGVSVRKRREVKASVREEKKKKSEEQ